MTKYPLHKTSATMAGQDPKTGGVAASPLFPELEKEVLAYWTADNTFQASIDNRPAGINGSNEYVFYDGPPFANGLPHYGHLLTGYVKDAIGRFRTQLGSRVERRFGWDTHGLPAELEAQRILGVEDKEQIEGPDGCGIEKFNEVCRSSVLRYTKEWEESVTRQARWVDFENDYKTYDLPYMESVLWAFKALYDKGLAYEGYRVLPYCWNDETPLSNHELKMDDDVYQDRQDTTVTVALPLENGAYILIWTTTPWTLPSNLAVAVGPDIEYVEVQPSVGVLAGKRVILGAARLAAYAKELGSVEAENLKILATYQGRDLVGIKYHPIFNYFDTADNRSPGATPGESAWTVIAGEFVTTEDGTGVVHMAPAFGEDDMNLCTAAGIKAVVPVDEAGKFTSEVPDYAGLQVFAANRPIINDLRDASGPFAARLATERAVLVQEKSYVHSYPHCWRCRQPLIYKAVSSWFVAVTKIRDRMVELNQEIHWVPQHLRDGQFGNWLAGARDWSITRNRFWGAPLPVWKSDDPAYPRVDVYGSLAELEADFGVEVKDLHRPFIDTLVRPNPDDPTGKSLMRRIPDVFDCWFESGSMPFAQVHYPFENQDWFEHHYPGDFIVEYVGQTRGWFYTLHVLATALFDRPAFRNCLSHGIILGDDGRKASKSLRNYPDVEEMFNVHGADAMRWYLLSSPVVRGGNLSVSEKGVRDTVRQILLPLWNTWYFYALYANQADNAEGYVSAGVQENELPTEVMDRYLLAATKDLVETVKSQLEDYEVVGACETIRAYLDVLTNWYLRTSRDRFTSGEHAAFDTLHTALKTLVQVMAALLPLTSEEIYRGLTGERSVHLTDWPNLPDSFADPELVKTMDTVRSAVTALLSLRKANNRRVRHPLSKASVVVDNPQPLQPFVHLMQEELNLKELELLAPAQSEFQVKTEVSALPREFAPEMRKLTSAIFAACKQGNWRLDGESLLLTLPDSSQITLQPGQFESRSLIDIGEGSTDLVAEVLPGGGFVVLDIHMTAQIKAEGLVRDVIRLVQDERKNAGLEIGQPMQLQLMVPAADLPVIAQYQELIASETIAKQVEIVEANDYQVQVTGL